MKIQRFFPSTALKAFIREFLIIETDVESESKTIPDTSMAMAFRYRGNIQKIQEEIKEALPASAIAGIGRSARYFSYSKQTANLLVIFKEGGFNLFAGKPAHELFGLHISTDNLFLSSEVAEILERLAEAKSNDDRIDIMEIFLLGKFYNAKPDHLIANAIRLIKQHHGMIRIRDLAASLHISQDPFEKRFRTVVGATPKQYASIIRLRKLIRNVPSLHSLTAASYEAGYFDQSHFIKDFRLFTGQAPKDFFRSPSFW